MKKLGTRYRRALTALLVLVAGCTSGGGDGDTAPLTLAVTDAASGATVGALPAPVVVDLVTLAEVSQVLNVLNVPLGLYTQATVTLDFDQAKADFMRRFI